MSNASFTNVSNSAGFLSDLNVSDLKVEEISANNVPIVDIGNFNRVQYVGYAPTTFVGNSGVFSLNSSPGGTTATATTAVVVPSGSLIESVQLGNNGTTIVGGTNFDVHLHTALNTQAGTGILINALLATVNGGAISKMNATGTAAGLVGTHFGGALAADNYINLGSIAAVTAGDARAVVTALVPKSN